MDIEWLRSQRDEFTALQNIYLDQFQVIKETAPYKFNVLCKPFKGNSMEYQINIMFEYTQKYPLTPLKYELEPIAGVTRDNVNNIVKKIEEIIESNQQQPVVFDIVEETRNWIHQYLVEGRSYEVQEVNVAKKVQVFERPKFAAFTPVTVENFLAWKKEFDAKHRVDKDKKKETEIKMTGKEWFLGKPDGVDDDSDDSEEDSDEESEEEAVEQPREPQNELFNG